ncbi:MAG: PSD1 and planctomycete cytochrome C domain-containing protein [Pirellulaceae bacterium]
MPFRLPLCCALLATWFPCLTLTAASTDDLTFERDIRPIFRAHCFDCHGATDEVEGGLDLRLVHFQTTGGDSGAAVVAGQPEDSLLLQRVEAGEMPPGNEKVTAEELATLRQWIAQGAKTARPEPEEIPPGLGITPEERDWWSFQPIERPETPTVHEPSQVRTPIDAFVLAKLQQNNLTFSPEADRRTLILRAYFDLLGLPPTAEQIEVFVNDPDPQAWEKLIDTLLESPHYGERWGRHWLDVAGYADSEGMTQDDRVRPDAYKYRDYVIRSLNADKPFDEFITEQLAGDELVPQPHANLTPQQIEKLIATGFLRMAADGTAGGVDQDMARNQVVGDTLKIVTTSLLGMTVGCAECHDHRYDPIPQRDYFAIRAVFEPALDWKAWKNPVQRRVSLYTDEDRAKAAEIEAEAAVVVQEKNAKQTVYMAEALEKELEKHPEELREQLRTASQTIAGERTPEQNQLLAERPSVNITPGVLYQYNQAAADDLKQFDKRIAEIRAKKPPEEFVRALSEPPGHLPETKLFHRGDYRQPQATIPPGDLQVASPEDQSAQIPVNNPELPTSGRRLAYAKHLTSGKHPLVARVLVNRFWMHHFGQGFVGTPGDFGRLGQLPTHPKLLNWLAAEFMENGWSLKQFHRQVMTSTVYRQSSRRRPEQDAIDSDNQLLARMPVRRLEGEILRDHVLAVTGTLQREFLGPPIPVAQDDTGQVTVENNTPRRSIYIQQRRSQPVSLLTTFDAPIMETNCEKRTSSTVAGQALLLMNNTFITQQSQHLANRVFEVAPSAEAPELAADLLARLARPRPDWSYGYGNFDEEAQRVEQFTPFETFDTETARWQGGSTLPSDETGWAMLMAHGGHTGQNPGFAVIRRWTATHAGNVSLSGTLQHGSEAGDGVRGRVVSSRQGVLGEWVAHNSQLETNVETFAVHPDETIDLVTDCRENVNADSFQWKVNLTHATETGSRTYDSAAEFAGPQDSLPPLANTIVPAWRLAFGRIPEPEEIQLAARFLATQLMLLQTAQDAEGKAFPPAARQRQALTNLCQQLLASNEFLYVD